MAQPGVPGVLSAEEALRTIRARSLQGHERDALKEAGRKKLEEYRKLKASVMNDIEKKLNLFTTTAQSTPTRVQGTQQPGTSETDPMVDVLLEQVASLMSDRQRLQAQCSTLQRENEQLTELVGYLSLELEQQQEQQGHQQQQEQQQLPIISDEPELEDSWYVDQEAMGADSLAVRAHSSSVSSMDAVYPQEVDSSVEEACQ